MEIAHKKLTALSRNSCSNFYNKLLKGPKNNNLAIDFKPDAYP